MPKKITVGSLVCVSLHRYGSLLTCIYTKKTVQSSIVPKKIKKGLFVGLFSQMYVSFDMNIHKNDSVLFDSAKRDCGCVVFDMCIHGNDSVVIKSAERDIAAQQRSCVTPCIRP